MHMFMWFGYDLGEFMFAGLTIANRWAFALTWIVLFFVALLFEASKVYLAKIQREAYLKLYPYRSDERRNLLCDREQQGSIDATTSRNASNGQVSRWNSFKVRVLVNMHQSTVFVVHNVVGYLLMLAVMVYNVHLLLAVLFGMMLGYFLFGTKLTKLRMQCFSTKRLIICTPECDDTAENTPANLVESAASSESDFFICQTRTCIQPSHYFRATTSQDGTCSYGAKHCPSKVARAQKTHNQCHHVDTGNESQIEAQPLRSDRQGCCKKKQEPPPPPEEVEGMRCCKKEGEALEQHDSEREESPKISCCHAKSAPTESQEQIVT